MASPTSLPPQYKISRRLTNTVKLAACLFLVVLVMLFTVPYGLKMGLSRWLQEAGVAEVEIGDVDFNPFLGRLILKSVQLRNQDLVGLRAAEMLVTFDWWPFWQGRFKVKNLQIEDGSFALRHLADERWRIGGIPLTVSTGGNDSPEAVVSAGTSWEFGAENISIKNMVISFHDWHWQEKITVVSARLENLATWEKDGAGDFAVIINKGPGTLDFAGEIKPFAAQAALQATLKLEHFPLGVLAPLLAEDGADMLEGSATGELALQATYDQAQQSLHYQALDSIKLTGAAYQSAAAQLQPVELVWEGSSRADLRLADEQFAVVLAGSLSGSPLSLTLSSVPYQLFAEQLSLKGEVSVSRAGKGEEKVATTYQARGSAKGLQILDPAQGLNIMRLSRLSVDSVKGSNGQIAIKKLEGSRVEFLERGKGQGLSKSQQEYVVVVDDVALENIEISEQGFVNIDQVRLQDAECLLLRNSQGEMEFGRWQAGPPEVSAVPDKPAGGGLRIGSFALTGNNWLVFADHFLVEPYKEIFDPLTLEIGVLDSREPRLQTPVRLEAGVGSYGSLSLAGMVTPFAGALSIDLEGKVSALELPPLNPYAGQYLFYRFESGQLDADIILKVEAGVMDSEANILVEKLKVKRVKEGEDRFQQITGLPFQYTVDLLRDKQDDIRFRLPVKGDMRSPDFQFGDVVTKAVLAAVKKATLSYYAPLGVTLLTGVTLPVGTLYVSGQVFDWATALSFKPVAFGNGSPELAEESRQYLDTIAKLLGDRPKVRVVLCGKATLAELATVPSFSGKQPPEKTDDISESEKIELLELAGSRARQVKEYLIIQGIEPKRLILCEPGIDSTQAAAPRVEVSI